MSSQLPEVRVQCAIVGSAPLVMSLTASTSSLIMAGCELGEAWQTPIACLFLLCVTPTQASSAPFNRCPLHLFSCDWACVLTATPSSWWMAALMSLPICLLDPISSPSCFARIYIHLNFLCLSFLYFNSSLVMCVRCGMFTHVQEPVKGQRGCWVPWSQLTGT